MNLSRFMSILVVASFLSTGCAIIVKGSRQNVFFKSGPEKGVTKVASPDGTVKHGQADTRFDWLAGGLGNWWIYFIGSIFDATNDKGYDIDDVSLVSYCQS